NILQLKKQQEAFISRELVEASILQKANQIAVVPITQAVDLKKNKKYLPYLIPLLLIGVMIMIFSPSIFTDASERLLQPTKTFSKPAPFQFIILNKNMQAVRNGNFVLHVKAEGHSLPAAMSVVTGNDEIPMVRTAVNEFQYSFKNLTEAVAFKLYASGFYSSSYKIDIV